MSNEFVKNQVYKFPKEAFSFYLEPIDDIKNEALIVLDANVLLLPFTTDVKNAEAIKMLYSQLTESNQLFLPAQAVREYLDNRAQKLSDINEALQKKANQSFNFVGAHPLLSSLPAYKEVIELEENLKTAIKGYQKKIRETLNSVHAWGWNDPVSKMYHDILSDRVLNDEHLDHEEIKKDLERRNRLNLPPGFKDKNKTQNQGGDLYIWHEILTLAEKENKHLIFVSGDEKADWWHQSGKNPLYPRFELVDEFRERTNGKSFHILSLSKLLKTYDTEKAVVDAIEKTESESRILSNTCITGDVFSSFGLSDESIFTIKNMSEDKDGSLLYLRYIGGIEFRTNKKCLNNSSERREIAKWEGVIDELTNLGFIIPRGSKKEIFELTKSGYDLADLMQEI